MQGKSYPLVGTVVQSSKPACPLGYSSLFRDSDPTPNWIFNLQNVLGTHHASAHGGSSDLIVKMLD